MRIDIKRDQLAQIPYLDISALGDRRAHLMPLWDGAQWHMWVPRNEKLEHITPLDAMWVDYVARHPANDSDVTIPFIEFAWQRASWPEACPFISGIIHDFHNLATSVAKIDHYFKAREQIGKGVTLFVSTEFEHLFIFSKSVLDLLHETVASIWKKRIKLNDPAADRRKGALPQRLSRILLREGEVTRSADEIARTFSLPPALSAAYATAAPFFGKIREHRDAFVHGGRQPSWFFDTEKGFCIEKGSPEFNLFTVWKEEHGYNERLVSVRPLIAHLVSQTIATCNDLMESFARQIRFPEEIAPGYKIFTRGLHNTALTQLRMGSPWWS